MLFTLRKIGNSYGVIIPKGFIKEYSDGKGIELHFDMSPREQEMVRGAEPIETPDNAEEIIAEAETVEEVIAEDKKKVRTDRPDFYTTCNKHKGFKGRCGCK